MKNCKLLNFSSSNALRFTTFMDVVKSFFARIMDITKDMLYANFMQNKLLQVYPSYTSVLTLLEFIFTVGVSPTRYPLSGNKKATKGALVHLSDS